MVKKKMKDRCEDVPKTAFVYRKRIVLQWLVIDWLVFRRVASTNFKKIDRVIADLTKFWTTGIVQVRNKRNCLLNGNEW